MEKSTEIQAVADHRRLAPILEGVEFNIADIFDNAKSRIHSKTDLKMIRKGWSRKFMLLVLCFVCSREV